MLISKKELLLDGYYRVKYLFCSNSNNGLYSRINVILNNGDTIIIKVRKYNTSDERTFAECYNQDDYRNVELYYNNNILNAYARDGGWLSIKTYGEDDELMFLL